MPEDSVEIWFRVEKDSDGHPNQDWEQLHAWPIEGGYRLNDIPFFVKDVALDDVVAIWEFLTAGQLLGDWDLQVGFSPDEL
jgi:hypothetical protein